MDACLYMVVFFFHLNHLLTIAHDRGLGISGICSGLIYNCFIRTRTYYIHLGKLIHFYRGSLILICDLTWVRSRATGVSGFVSPERGRFRDQSADHRWSHRMR